MKLLVLNGLESATVVLFALNLGLLLLLEMVRQDRLREEKH
jgi:hypothetical protein